jgi:hypothetical protein
MGRCEISTELVSTSDNSVVIRETSLAYDHIKGVWDLPPDYLKLRGSIQAAIREVMATEKKKYDKVGL